MTRVRLLENKMENELTALLRKRYGDDNVVRQKDFADLRVHQNGTETLIEIKACHGARRAIRDALGQLLDYGYYRTNSRHEPRLMVVGRTPLGESERRYLRRLRDRFGLEISYRAFRPGIKEFRL